MTYALSTQMAQQIGGDEPPPPFSVQYRPEVRERFVRSTVPAGGGRSPFSLGQNRMGNG